MAVLRLPPLRPYQEPLVTSPAREVVVVSATQVGKTVGCSAWALARRWSLPGSLGIWAAPIDRQTRPGFLCLRDMAQSAGVLIPGPRGVNDSPGNRILRFINGSEEHFVSWERAENLLGPTGHDVVVDEAGLLTLRARIILSSRRSATLGPVRYIGNPGPTLAEFWNLCEQAQDPDNSGRMSFFRWTWEDRARCLPPEERREYEAFIASERRDLGSLFGQYYEARFEEPEGAIFSEGIAACTTLGPAPAFPNPHKGHRYLVAWDIGQKHDYTCGIAGCINCRTFTGLLRLRGLPYDQMRERIWDYTKAWNDARGVIEVNGPGQPLLDDLSARPGSKFTGWTTTTQSKRSSVVAALGLLNAREASFAEMPPFQAEMRSYTARENPRTHVWTFEGPKEGHDDTVSAFLIWVGATQTGPVALLEMFRDEQDAARKAREEKERAEGKP